MEITCSQFEGLLSFYLNGDLTDNMKKSVEEHMSVCSACAMRFEVVNSIIEDIKAAYNEVLNNAEVENCCFEKIIEPEYEVSDEDMKISELSAYIDNELGEEESIKIRRSIIAKPKLRNKVEKLYGLKKMMSDSFKEHRSKLKTDYSKEIVKNLNSSSHDRQVYLHCVGFILFVVCAVVFSIIALVHLL